MVRSAVGGSRFDRCWLHHGHVQFGSSHWSVISLFLEVGVVLFLLVDREVYVECVERHGKTEQVK